MKIKIVLVIIALLAFFLRAVNISNNPPSLYGDELTLVYDAYSLLKTGMDQTGAFLPLTFTLSEGRPPVYVYFTIPVVAIFGPNALGVRILSILSGVGLVILIYFLTSHLLDTNSALFASFFWAISPWDLSLSRGGFETHLALFLSILGITALVKAKKKPPLFILSAISLGLAMNTYHSYKLVLPLFLPPLFWYLDYLKVIFIKQHLKYFIPFLLIFLFSLVVWLSQFIGGSDVRFNNTNIFNQADIHESIIQKINSERTISKLPPLLNNVFHNKLDEYGLVLVNNYFDHFSLNFLFLKGDGNPRHNMGLTGELYLIQAFLIILAIIYLYQTNRRLLLMLMFWVLVSPLATIMVSPAHALRSTFMLPPLIILSSYGTSSLWNLSKKVSAYKAILYFIVIGLLIQFLFLIDRIYFLYPYQFGNFWSLSAKQASEIAMEKSPSFDKIILSDRIDSIEFAYPAYSATEPKLVIDQNKNLTMLNGIKFKKLGNVFIGSVPDSQATQFIQQIEGKILYIGPNSEKIGNISSPLKILEKNI